MTALHEARFYEPLRDNKVLCTLCPHDCRSRNNGRGACSVRYNRDGRIYTLVYDKVVAREVNPISSSSARRPTGASAAPGCSRS